MNDIENEKEVASNPSKVAQEIIKPEVFEKSEVLATARKVNEGIVMKDKLAEYMKRKATLKEEHKKSRKPVFVTSVKNSSTQVCDESVNGSNSIKGPNMVRSRSSVASQKLMRLNDIKSNRETKSKVKAPGKKETTCERKGLKEIDKNVTNLSLERARRNVDHVSNRIESKVSSFAPNNFKFTFKVPIPSCEEQLAATVSDVLKDLNSLKVL